MAGYTRMPVGWCKFMQKPLLSICIPTYNRAPHLDWLLGNIWDEIQGLGGQVEICVSDNASSDETPSVLSKWKKKFPIAYGRNNANVGYDGNIIKVSKMARGDYIWFCGDDDAFLPGSIKKMLLDTRVALKKKAGAIYANFLYMPSPNQNKMNIGEFGIYLTSQPLPGPLDPAFIGAVCVNRRLAQEVISRKISIKGNECLKREIDSRRLCAFMHSYLFAECLAASNCIGVEPSYCVALDSIKTVSSFEKFMYLQSIFSCYNLEMRAFYGSFNFRPGGFTLGGYFSKAAIAAQRPDLEEVYSLSAALYFDSLGFMRRRILLFMLKQFEKVRKNSLVAFFLVFSYSIVLKIHPLCKFLSAEKKPEPYINELLHQCTLRAKILLGVNGIKLA